MRNASRIIIGVVAFAAVYAVIFLRLAQFGMSETGDDAPVAFSPSVARPDILDRNGTLLAVDLPTGSVYAEPSRIVDVDEAVEKLTSVLTDLDAAKLYRQLSNKKARFTWIRRKITPAERQAIFEQGVPGVGFRDETMRLYPNGTNGAHFLGAVNVDNRGIAGIEKWIDQQGLGDLRQTGIDFKREGLEPVQLSMDLRIQHALRDELAKAVDKFSAIAASGLVLDVTNGEVIALASLPDFDPNQPADALKSDRINRINVGVYEMGSTFKALNTALALESGQFNVHSVLDASRPLQFGRFRIHDFHAENRPLSMPEAFIYSSNIAMARMATQIGIDSQRRFLKRFGQLDRLTTELPESASPILPRNWQILNTATISFGHGLAVTPLQASMAVAALVNGGNLIRPTFIKGREVAPRLLGQHLVSDQTGEALRYMMRLNAEAGSARKAEVPGYYMGGKTGTAEKVVGGRYSKDKVLTSFMGVVPAEKPRYLFLVMLDEPKALKETYGFRASGWNAVPVAGGVIKRIVPMLGIAPSAAPRDPFPQTVRARAFGWEHFVGHDITRGLPSIEASWAVPVREENDVPEEIQQ
ncbi:penicillin-binding protein 2 [Jiella sp. CQZ9-1]|uniref:Penicillin-binding protein 2 n=1 Tax=Jiella flava TaxID=2816857 RepID=A0A939G1W7_9HYPH|nr:penicillin-binding protein 2 [Jiella flava]MBO0663509.1 penicillin-binding protein 2 [Jiella flava]